MRRISAARLVDHSSASARASRRIELPFLLRLLADLAAQLLRGDERFVDRLVALAERAQLLVKAARLGVEILVDARQPLELLGHLLAKLIDALGIVAAQRLAELVAANVERREMKGLVDHADLAPKRIVPRRTSVAPSSTATS